MSICFSDFNKICEFLMEIFHSYVYKADWGNGVTVFNFIDPNYKIEISVLNLEEKITVQIIYKDIMLDKSYILAKLSTFKCLIREVGEENKFKYIIYKNNFESNFDFLKTELSEVFKYLLNETDRIL